MYLTKISHFKVSAVIVVFLHWDVGYIIKVDTNQAIGYNITAQNNVTNIGYSYFIKARVLNIIILISIFGGNYEIQHILLSCYYGSAWSIIH